ncbi:hypothetical protein ACFQH6_12130 [Halobacteriaceae archaeon GCM10025711]
MELSVTTLLDAPTERVWDEVQKPALLEHVAYPLLTFTPVDGADLPDRFDDGDEIQVELKLFGVVPMGTQWIRVSIPETRQTPGAQLYRIRDDGSGQIVSTWDHLITIRETPDGKTVYTDEVEIDAGVLTLFVWLFSNVFYRYRQARWRRLVDDGFEY